MNYYVSLSNEFLYALCDLDLQQIYSSLTFVPAGFYMYISVDQVYVCQLQTLMPSIPVYMYVHSSKYTCWCSNSIVAICKAISIPI